MAEEVALWPEAATLTCSEHLAQVEPEAPRCTAPGCLRPIYSEGLCKLHADLAWYLAGCPSAPPARSPGR